MLLKKILASIGAVLIIFLFIGVSDFDLLDIEKVVAPKNIGDSNQGSVLEKNEVIITRAIDGDTVIVINDEGEEERVRLLLIDTSESVDPNEPVQRFGKEASDFAKEYLEQGKKVILERGNPKKDKYDRTLGYIFVDGVNFNELMIKKGYARVAYVIEPNTKYLDEFKAAEKQAKDKKLNIWSIPNYVTEKGFDMSVVE